MRRTLPLYWTFFLAISAVGCAPPKVGYDYDRSANLGRYQSYAWGSGGQQATGDRRVDSSLVDARIRSAIDSELRAKGYTAASNGRPEFLVTYHVGIKDMMKGASTQHYIGDRAHGTFTTMSDIQPFSEGALLIDIVDSESQRLVWQASAQAEVDQGLDPKERDARMTAIVRAMLSHFPPP
jgi:hypothetical protein